MSPPDDFTGEMLGFPLMVGEADALLEGRVEPDEAPLGFQEVATLVLAARSLHANGGLAGENSVVAAFVKSVHPPLATVAPIAAGPRRSAGRLSAKVAAGAAAVLAFGGASAAAATGSLPGTVQGALSRNLSHIGIHVPDPQTGPSTLGVVSNAGAGNTGNGRSAALTAPSTTANEYGLCTAYFATDGRSSTNTTRGSALSSVAFSRLTAAAAANGESVTAFCASIPKPGTSTTTAGSDGTSSTDSGGKPATNPAGKTPGSPTTTPAGNTGGGGQPASNPAGNTPGGGQSSTTAAGNTPGGGQPATNPAGNTPGGGRPSTNPAGKSPGAGANNSAGQSETDTTQ